ncbi:MAG TPA: phosphoribosyl-AMP cyclohydrolase [Elusimicrobiota bacterium]|nr:phosphoribosyl-AMP cyclohydrolase [Elusimicrobiota bacterium]
MKNLQQTLKFDDKQLIPVVVQDAKDGIVLMVAYMNREAVKRTLKLKKAVYWSRSRQSFWLKGESSGNVQKVKEMRIDCDGDCLLIKVDQIGRAACHTGRRSCFYRKVQPGGRLRVQGKPLFDPSKVYGPGHK